MRKATILPPILFGLLSFGAAQAQINVTSYGAKADGVTDNTAALNSAFAYANAHPGQKLYFPCNSGTTYLIKSPITFPSRTTLQGDSSWGCKIFYNPSSNPGTVQGAFNFINSGYVVIRDLMLQTGSAYPPQAITIMGGIHGNASQNLLDTVTIKGYATQVMSYAVASEVNTFKDVYWESQGGGASYGFYTTAQDDLGICSACQSGSNLSLFFSNNSFVSFDNSHPFNAVADKIGGGTGDHYYRDNVIALNYNLSSSAFEFISGAASQGGPNGQIAVFNSRVENGGYAFHFRLDSQTSIYNLDIEGVSWVSTLGNPSYFSYGDDGLTLSQFRMVHNVASQGGVTGPSSFDTLTQSTLDESYGPITIRATARNNILMMRGNGSVSLPGNSSQNALIVNGGFSTR